MEALQVAPDLAGPDNTAALQSLLHSLQSVFAQFTNGNTTPTVSFTDVSKLGGEALESWKAAVE